MAQAATMGPPLSPRETRRSGRRSAHSASASTSKSPDSPAPESLPKTKDTSTRSAVTNHNPNGRTKRPKQEDIDDTIPSKSAQLNGAASNHAHPNGRAKRKGKEKEKLPSMDQVPEPPPSKHSSDSANSAGLHDDDTEEQGITRCVCGMNGPSQPSSPGPLSSSAIPSTEEDADGGEFMVQCEICNVWQHGLCMGFDSEAQLAAAADYYCEECKPERHQDLLMRLAKRVRESSTQTHSRNTTSRLSRSHSPTHPLKSSKRRNTMNSRDAAFAEDLNEVIKATAAEAAAATDPPKSVANGCTSGPNEIPDDESSGRKKRKRAEDEDPPKKRTRSASSASDGPDVPAIVAPEEAPPPTKRSAGGKSGNSRSRRGGPRKSVPTPHDGVVSVEGEEVTGPSKRSSQATRGKTGPTPKRPPLSSHVPGSVSQDSVSKRNHSGGVVGASSAENSRAYRNSHTYAISQQPLFTSWNLPDYLAHLEHMLPTDIPRPLEVRSLAIGLGGRESLERTMERGVKVKWPSKRTSVGDMNKRVRALVEWVGREQAGALDRGRRREALERALKSGSSGTGGTRSSSSVPDDRGMMGRGSPMVVDNSLDNTANPRAGESSPRKPAPLDLTAHQSTMKMMEELMEELIIFQERFGPGVKSRERERRPAS